MIQTDEDALICDLAETYYIYDYKGLPLTTVASLAVGLREESRIKMRLSGLPASPEFLLLAAAVDRLSLLVWSQTSDASKGRNRPKSILESLVPSKRPDANISYASGKDFDEARNRMLQKIKGRRKKDGN